MTTYDQEELEQYEQVSKDLAARGKLEVLAMVNNRLLKMRAKADYDKDLSAQRVIEDLLKFMQHILFEELVHLGELAQTSYQAVSDTWDLKTVLETELEYARLRDGQIPD